MGWKIMKFHVNVHLSMDIRLFGVPLEFDTSSNESGHKESKVAAKLPQKNVETFDFQTCTRLDEFLLVDLAHTEMHVFPLHKYYEREEAPAKKPTPVPPVTVGGAPINILQHLDGGGHPVYSIGVGTQAKTPSKVAWHRDAVSFLWLLKQKLQVKSLKVRPEFKRDGLIFRGSPDYKGKFWRDWAIFDWGGAVGERPGQIWCFVDTTLEPLGGATAVQHDGVDLERTVYAVVERGYYGEDAKENGLSSIFLPFRKEIRSDQGIHGWKRKFYLIKVDALKRPLAVIPNIGGHSGVEYFSVLKRRSWVDPFVVWLEKPISEDVSGPEEHIPTLDRHVRTRVRVSLSVGLFAPPFVLELILSSSLHQHQVQACCVAVDKEQTPSGEKPQPLHRCTTSSSNSAAEHKKIERFPH
jgi:hypothetical protein